MFIFDMIYMSINANLGLIAFVALLAIIVLLNGFGEKWLEAFIEKHPWWNEEIDLFAFARRKK